MAAFIDEINNPFESEDGIINMLDTGMTFCSKERRPYTDTFKIGDRIVVNIPGHSCYLHIGKVIKEENNRFLVCIRHGNLQAYLDSSHLLHLSDAKRRFRDKIVSK
jgi:hypothetical protein